MEILSISKGIEIFDFILKLFQETIIVYEVMVIAAISIVTSGTRFYIAFLTYIQVLKRHVAECSKMEGG